MLSATDKTPEWLDHLARVLVDAIDTTQGLVEWHVEFDPAEKWWVLDMYPALVAEGPKPQVTSVDMNAIFKIIDNPEGMFCTPEGVSLTFFFSQHRVFFNLNYRPIEGALLAGRFQEGTLHTFEPIRPTLKN